MSGFFRHQRVQVTWAEDEIHPATVVQIRPEVGAGDELVQALQVVYDDGQILWHHPYYMTAAEAEARVETVAEAARREVEASAKVASQVADSRTAMEAEVERRVAEVRRLEIEQLVTTVCQHYNLVAATRVAAAEREATKKAERAARVERAAREVLERAERAEREATEAPAAACGRAARLGSGAPRARHVSA